MTGVQTCALPICEAAEQSRVELERMQQRLRLLNTDRRLHDELDRAYSDMRAELNQHLRDGAYMGGVMERLQLEDFVVSTDGTAVESVAAEIIRRLGWSPAGP